MASGQTAILGAGVMGETLLSGLVRAGRRVDNLLVGEKRESRARELEERYGVAVVSNIEATQKADTLALVVKPQDMGEGPRRDTIPDREAVDPAREQLVRVRVDGHRPPIANHVPISRADLDGKARASHLVDHSRQSRTGARRRFETGM